LSIASNIINIVVLIIQRYSFITTLFLGPFDDVITKFYCISKTIRIECMWKHCDLGYRLRLFSLILKGTHEIVDTSDLLSLTVMCVPWPIGPTEDILLVKKSLGVIEHKMLSLLS
jgi:hypothetical protein